MEDYAYILDFLPQGLMSDRGFKREPLAYGLGDTEFKLLELSPRFGAVLNIGDRVYIGKDADQRTQIQHVKRRVGHNDLTNTAQSELPFVILEIIKGDPDRFIRFYNEAGAITTRFHMLELIPGLGKKTMWAVLDERKKGKFKGFEELEERVPALHHPDKLIAKRIELELADPGQKYHVFVAR